MKMNQHPMRLSCVAALLVLMSGGSAAIAAPVDLSETRPTTVAPWLNAPLQLDEEDRFRLNAARLVFAKQFSDLRPRIAGRDDLGAALDLLEIADFEASLVAIDDIIAKEPELAVAHEIRGVALAYQGRIDEAIGALETSAAADPSQAGPLTKLGDIYMALNRTVDSREAYARAVAAAPDNRRAQSRLGISLEAAGAYEEAKEPLRLSLKDTPPRKLTNTKTAYARALLMTNDPGAAAAVLAPAVDEKDGFLPNALLGMSFLAAGRYEQAIRTFAPLTEKNPDNSLLAYFLGRAYAQKGDTEKAVEAFTASAKNAPDPTIAKRDLAAVYLADGKVEKAEEILESLRAGENATSFESRLLGEIHAVRGDLAGAEVIYASIIENFPDEPVGYHKLGTIQAAQTRYGEAADTLKSGLAVVGPDPQLLRSLVLIQLRGGDVEGAAESADTLTALPDAVAGSFALAGSVQERRGNANAAEKYYRKAIDLDSENAAALNNLAYLLSLRGELQQARWMAEKARAVDVKNPTIAQNLGWILYQMEEPKTAAKLLEEAAAAPNSDARVHYRLGLALIAAGKQSRAKAALQTAVDASEGLSPEEASDAEKHLQALESK